MALENIAGNLRDAYALVDPKTMLHSDELQIERLTNPELRNQSFYPADGPLYRMHEGSAQLGLTRRAHNLVLRHIDDACTQLIDSGNYHPSQEEVEASFAAETTLCVDLSQLRLEGDNKKWGYLPILTRKYNALNIEERKLAERVYASGDAFVRVMAMLAGNGIEKTRIAVLNPSYVQEQTKNGPIGRASWLFNFDDNSNFSADDRDVDNRNRLRGVPRVGERSEPMSAEGALQKIPTLEEVLAVGSRHVPDSFKADWEKDLRALYKS